MSLLLCTLHIYANINNTLFIILGCSRFPRSSRRNFLPVNPYYPSATFKIPIVSIVSEKRVTLYKYYSVMT